MTVRLVGPDAVNGAPEVVDDTIDTGAGVAVVVEVLANDLDPERDLLRIAEFTAPGERRHGERDRRPVRAAGAALRTGPGVLRHGRRSTYRGRDVLDAVSDPATVRVDVARPAGRRTVRRSPGPTPCGCAATSPHASRCWSTTSTPTAIR